MHDDSKSGYATRSETGFASRASLFKTRKIFPFRVSNPSAIISFEVISANARSLMTRNRNRSIVRGAEFTLPLNSRGDS